MNLESVRAFCLSLPHVTENIQWEIDLCFKIAGGPMICVMPTEPAPVVCSFKCTPEKFLELQEIEGIIPAPYMARAHWVALERFDVLRDTEFKELLAEAYRLKYESLTKKRRAELEGTAPAKKPVKKAAKKAVKKTAPKDTAARKRK
jgi:predicted DNA-binding protein (MmcQ/YjbR family)